MEKLIIRAPREDWLLAQRAAKLLEEGRKDSIFCFENGQHFYVKRNKGSITVRLIP